MECPKCGMKNRESARFCNDCGADITGGPINCLRLERPRFHSMMRLDWLLRFVTIAILGSAMGIVSFLWDEPAFALLFLCMGLFGWACTVYMLSHR